MFFENTVLFGEQTVNALHIDAGRWLDYCMAALTHLGSKTFFALLLLYIFWCVNKRIAVIIGLTLVISTALNDILKTAFNSPRPDPIHLTEKIARLNIMHSPPNEGFPSGHTQSAIVFWGLLAYFVRRRTFTLCALFLIMIIPYTRIYLGVHFLGDIAGGIVIGAVILFMVVKSAHHYDSLWNMRRLSALILFLFIPLLLLLVFHEYAIAKLLGFLSGFSIGFIANKTHDEEVECKLIPSLLKYILGLSILIILIACAVVILPKEVPFLFTGFWIIGAWISYGAPLLFNIIPHLSKKTM